MMVTYTKWALGFALAVMSATAGMAERQEVPGESAGAIHDRAAAALMRGRLDEALAGFNKALELDPRSALAHYNRGNVHYLRRDYARAIEDFDRAIAIQPDFAFAYMNRAVTLSDLGRLDEALIDMDRAVALDAKNSDPLYNRAIVHVRKKNYDKAISDYRSAVERDAGDAEAAAALDRLLLLLGRDATKSLESIDTSQIAAEIMHARQVEHILRLTKSSCVALGDDIAGLHRYAMQQNWNPASPERLRKDSTPEARLIDGWTFADRFGSYAVMRSLTERMPAIVCSLTTMLSNPHLMEDLRKAFEGMFEVGAARDLKRDDLTTHWYRIYRGKELVRATLVTGTKALSLRFIFSRRGEQQ